MSENEYIKILEDLDFNLEGDINKATYSTHIAMMKGLLDEIYKLKETITLLELRVIELEK